MSDAKPLTDEQFDSMLLVIKPFSTCEQRFIDYALSLRARAEQAERDRDVLAAEVQVWRAVDKSAWEFSVELLQAKSDTDASAALARAGEVRP